MISTTRCAALAAGTLTALALVAPSAGATTGAAADTADLAPLHAVTGEAVPGSYIVVLEDQRTPTARDLRTGRDVTSSAAERAEDSGATVTHEFRTAINGYAAELTPAQLVDVRTDPAVAYVEPDQEMTTAAVQNNATWGLDRIDQRNLPLNGQYVYDRTGAGVSAYIIDTGVLTSHREFAGRTARGFTSINDGRGTSDCNGHGTHVAGTVGGTVFGVAKSVTIVPVRVLDCNGSGSNAGVIAGMDWVASNAQRPAVANMSLGGPGSQASDQAVARMTSAGVSVVVAAGNENQNACNVSPARSGNAVTIGSTTRQDARSSFSNFGQCVDLFAPGSDITSAWSTGTTATRTISGTSMASPHAAGVAALILQGSPNASPGQVKNALVGTSTTNVLRGIGSGSPNRLLYSR